MSDTVDAIVSDMWTAVDRARVDYYFAADVEQHFRSRATGNVREMEKENKLDEWSSKGARKNVRRLLSIATQLAETAQEINDPQNAYISWKTLSKALDAAKGGACPSDGPKGVGAWCKLGWIDNPTATGR
jgi:hypothetical protein